MSGHFQATRERVAAIDAPILVLQDTTEFTYKRSKFKGTNALKRRINPTRMPIEKKESFRWIENMRQSSELLGTPEKLIHVGDRENDIYEFFCAAQEIGTHFLVRTCVNRLAGEGKHTIADEIG
ncbi:MAG: hypothetical protein COB14_04270 [Alphaproteobacteria bacterium]|nr:MAG: hypothetical protein COB14_04270 [Alphaproteobacteria bacterium]